MAFLLLPILVVPSLWAQLDGQLAVKIWAGDGRFATAPMDLPHCAAHLVADTALDDELSFPCGQLFIPPPGRYLYWAEGEGRISPDHVVMVFSGGAYQGRPWTTVRDTVPAGQVRFPEMPANPDLTLRLLHLESHLFEDRIYFEFHRRLPANKAATGARLPAGRAVALLYDNSKKEYLALGRPFSVPAGGEASQAAPLPPAATSVLAVFERPTMIERRSQEDLAPFLVTGERRLTPDLVFGDAARLYALWYEVTGASARLGLVSATWRIEETTVALRRGKVEVFRPRLLPPPQLKVSLRRPEPWEDAAVDLFLLDPGQSRRAALQHLELAPGVTEAVFAAIPARELEVELKVGSFSLREAVDARDGLGHEVFFEPAPIELEGQVFAGDVPSRATISFFLNTYQSLPEARDDRLVVETGSDGRYRAALYEPGWVPISIQLAGRKGLPFLISPRLHLDKSRTLDFHLPANRFALQVVDRASGKGISRAQVIIENHFGADNAFVTSTSDLTSARGELALPPIRSGRLELKVRAAGYREAARTVEVAEKETGSRVRIELAPEDEGDEIRVVLPGGAPASGAEAALFAGVTDSSEPRWLGRADPEGRLELPREHRGGILLLRHPAAGGTALALEDAGEMLGLPPRARDLQIAIRRRSGEIAPATPVAIRFGEILVAGRALGWLLQSALSSADGAGLFRAAGLPAARLEILAWAPELQASAQNGQLAAFASPLDPREIQDLLELQRIE